LAPTKLPLYLTGPHRVLLEAAAKTDGLKLSNWIRSEALKAARRKLDQLAPETEPVEDPTT
jgi:hypothetical protein